MQFITLVALFASAVTGFSIVARQGPPSCAAPCIANADLGSCDANSADLNHCLCTNATFVSVEAACFQSSCTDASQLAAANAFAEQLCEFAGVTLSSSAASSTASSTATSHSSSGTPSSTGSSAAPSGTAPTNSTTGAPPTNTSNAASSNIITGKSFAAMVGAVFFGLAL